MLLSLRWNYIIEICFIHLIGTLRWPSFNDSNVKSPFPVASHQVSSLWCCLGTSQNEIPSWLRRDSYWETLLWSHYNRSIVASHRVTSFSYYKVTRHERQQSWWRHRKITTWRSSENTNESGETYHILLTIAVTEALSIFDIIQK